MAAMYEKEDISFFGRLESRSFDLNEKEIESLYEEEIKNTKIDIKEHNLNISRYKNRVQGKIKDIRQNFSKVVVNGTRSGNGKIVFTHFDLLKEIWGGCANVDPLPLGIGNEPADLPTYSRGDSFIPVDVSSSGNSPISVEHFDVDHQQLEQTRRDESQS